ncbi:GNAT family N-acetyltransferase [Salinibacterium soli]|uniref:GNAT family N-acetyltransferase n=1 Tax=Antiquaquibacter soli TaxID=3064523 RepID=A0ABT9BRV7_9MICO|nr:GNAT family N-acetyltransferase [Protaetiibacter sp. WY-16]MDO7882521.1 GNAT family N-acetyltransferase [Protaetiibacter sp. WY-16]
MLIDELPIPVALDAPGGAEFARAVEIGNAVEAIAYGTADIAYRPEEELPHWRDRHSPHRLLLARVDGEIVGRASYETKAAEDTDTAWIGVNVLPEFEGRGIGRALADAVEELAASEGRTKLLAYTGTTEKGGERLASPTGFGSVPRDARATRFLLARGYSLEQVERVSRLGLPVDGLDALVADASAASGPDYRVVTWIGGTPERWRSDLALLGTRMSTDAPSAGLEEPEDVWTVERIVEADERDLASPRTRLTAAVEHVPTGRLVGFSVLSVPAQRERCVDQYATLVLREHRGHRLGMLLKVANLAHLERERPGHPSVLTFNAEENRPMLDVNEAVGFVPIAHEGAWRKDL